MTTLFSNAVVLPMTRSVEEGVTFRGSVGVIDNTIALVSDDMDKIEAFRRENPSLREIDLGGKVLMPGLINAHCHIPMTLLRGYSDDVGLMVWLNDHVWPFEGKLTPDDIEIGARLGIVEMLLGGTTSVVDMYWSEERVARAAKELGLRGIFGCTLLDHNTESIEGDILRALKEAEDSSLIDIAIAPHAPYSCSKETLELAVELAKKYDLPIISHLAETLDEEKIVKEQFGKTPMELYSELGLLNDRTIAAHCIYLSDSDISLMASSGAAAAHNPQSNLKISSGIAEITKLEKGGVLCTIGTDGACSNNDLDMWEEMRTTTFLQKSITSDPHSLPAYETLKLATVNGARAIGKEGKLGIISEGAIADLIVIDIFKPHLQPVHNIEANLVYSAKSSDVELVMIDGKILVEDSKVLGIDLAALYSSVNNTIERVKRELVF
ncbi:MAG: amidohydrolase [Rikenellaceae bacterium]